MGFCPLLFFYLLTHVLLVMTLLSRAFEVGHTITECSGRGVKESVMSTLRYQSIKVGSFFAVLAPVYTQAEGGCVYR